MGTDPTTDDPGTSPRAPGAPPTPPDGSYPFLSPPDQPGELGRLGRYRVVKLLGEGGMGFVFRAEDDELRRPVALKVMRPEIATQPTARERFLREARTAAAIRSDHVITIHDVGEANGVVFLAMEFLAGQNLDDWLKIQRTPAPMRAVLRVAKDVLKGLAAAHEKGLVHRDIKPANLWVETESNRIKLLDFGLTRNAGADRELTHTGQVLGTPAYMAPEQARGLSLDARADLFSVGVVLFRMIAGRSPFIFGEAFDPLPQVSSLGAGIPDALAELIDRLVAKRPQDRPESAKVALAVVMEIERQIRTGQPTPSTEVSVVLAAPRRPPRPEPSDVSQSEVYALPYEDDPEPVPERKRLGSGRGGIVAVGVVVVAILVAFVVVWKGGPNRAGDAKGKEVVRGGPEVGQAPGPSSAATSKGEKPHEPTPPTPSAKPEDKPPVTLERPPVTPERPSVTPERSSVTPERSSTPMPMGKEPAKKAGPAKTEISPSPREALLPGEIVETFKYINEGKEKDGKRRVLKVTLAQGVMMEFVRISKGSFLMGAPDGEKDAGPDEKQHLVEITRDFYLGKCEVTQAEYRAITGNSPSKFKGDLLPVENVSWDDAMAFCDKLKGKIGRKAVLPNEAQWEYACRAGTTTPFHFGSKLNGGLANCDGNFPYGTDAKGIYRETTVEGNTFFPNPWGLCNMHGNVWEWCQDYYGPYDKVKQEPNPIQLNKQTEDRRVLRGGSWGYDAWDCRAANRSRDSPGYRNDDVGFRVCLPLG